MAVSMVHHRARDGHLGQLEGDGTSMAYDTRPDLDQLQFQELQTLCSAFSRYRANTLVDFQPPARMMLSLIHI